MGRNHSQDCNGSQSINVSAVGKFSSQNYDAYLAMIIRVESRIIGFYIIICSDDRLPIDRARPERQRRNLSEPARNIEASVCCV